MRSLQRRESGKGEGMISTRERYLYERGWKQTCAFPDSRWRWNKVLKDGQRVSVSMADALSIQSEIDVGKS